MGFDGVPLSRSYKREMPLSSDVYEAIIVEFSPVIKTLYKKSDALDLGKLYDFSIATGAVNILFKVINANYFLAIVYGNQAYSGKIDYYANMELKRFQEEFGASK